MDLTHKKKYKYKYFILEFQGPTGPQILAPAVVWLATLTFGLASLNLIKLFFRTFYLRISYMNASKADKF